MKYIPIWLVHVKSKDLLEVYYSYNILGKTNESMYTEIPSYNLRKMILHDSYILNNNISFLKSIRTLEVLDISNTGSQSHRNSFTNYDELLDHPTWEGTMEILNLSQLNMGFFPESIVCLRLLKELYLSKNALVWLPEAIGCLKALEVLDISINSVCVLPSTIKELKNLRVLKLEHNRLADIILLKDLFNLKILDLYENELDWFELDIHRYQYLDLERNCFGASLLGATYDEKRSHYREKYNLGDRGTGCNNEYLEEALKSESSSESDFSEDSTSSNVIPDDNYEEECWDDEKVKSHKRRRNRKVARRVTFLKSLLVLISFRMITMKKNVGMMKKLNLILK
ncbi:hypothetical protein AMK59_2852 [Oryctes borbonicus]|uniref:Uncharacterized protein n=1 Tax=Oryctes borbonicus TaxID=1629725 RepID=A0A0T6BGY7_9SCAR|nr:hypothetical protein AMK59_2852 [Oryctes borbonicus]